MVRAKFRCYSIEERHGNGPDGKSRIVKLSAVSGRDNATWARYTPQGSIELTIDNPEAAAAFKVGEYYFSDLAPAPATEVAE